MYWLYVRTEKKMQRGPIVVFIADLNRSRSAEKESLVPSKVTSTTQEKALFSWSRTEGMTYVIGVIWTINSCWAGQHVASWRGKLNQNKRASSWANQKRKLKAAVEQEVCCLPGFYICGCLLTRLFWAEFFFFYAHHHSHHLLLFNYSFLRWLLQ